MRVAFVASSIRRGIIMIIPYLTFSSPENNDYYNDHVDDNVACY